MSTLAAVWDCRYPILAGVAIVYAVSAVVVRREARNAPLVDDYGPRVMYGLIERDPDESVAAVCGWDDWAAWEAEVASW